MTAFRTEEESWTDPIHLLFVACFMWKNSHRNSRYHSCGCKKKKKRKKFQKDCTLGVRNSAAYIPGRGQTPTNACGLEGLQKWWLGRVKIHNDMHQDAWSRGRWATWLAHRWVKTLKQPVILVCRGKQYWVVSICMWVVVAKGEWQDGR